MVMLSFYFALKASVLLGIFTSVQEFLRIKNLSIFHLIRLNYGCINQYLFYYLWSLTDRELKIIA